MGIINSLQNGLQSIYNFLFPTDQSDLSRNDQRLRNTPQKVKLTFDDTINRSLTKGLWENSVPGFKMGAPLCYNPIAVPLAFMGVPHTDIENWNKVRNKKFWEEKIKFYNEKYIQAKKMIQLLCHRDGTVWKWPWYDSKAGFVRWKTIFPDWIDNKKTIIDIDTEEIIQLVTSIRYEFYQNGQIYNFEEERIYAKKTIVINRTGQIPPGMNNQDIKRNVLGILPVRFANNIEPGELEGHSDYERIIPVIKAYSSINLRAHENEQNMRPKQIQKTDSPDQWKANNSHLYDGDNYIDISCVDLVLNKPEEDTRFEVPTGLNDNAIVLMRNDFWLIVETSGIPEICWGLKTEGNHASVEEQIGILLSFVHDKQNQANDPYLVLMTATLQLEAIASTQRRPEGIKNVWNDLSALTETEKAQIFRDYAQGIEKLLVNYAIDLQSAHKLLYELTNGMITSDFDDFSKQIKEYGTLKAFLEQEYISIRETEETGQQQNKEVMKAVIELSKENKAVKDLIVKLGLKAEGNGNGSKTGIK